MKHQARLRFLASLALAGLAVLSGCSAVVPPTQPPAKIPRIGILSAFDVAAARPRVQAVQQGLRELGYTEGQNIVLEYRYADGQEERLSELAAELVDLKVDVIVTTSSAGIRPAKNATSTIPIVMVADNADPVAVGYVASLAHPGGNVTGLTGLSPAVTQKRLELLRDTVPGMTRVGVLRNAASPDRELLWSETESAARTLGVQLLALDVRDSAEFEGAFAAAVRERSEGLIVLRDPLVNTNRPQIVSLAGKHRLPAMYASREFVDAGGLMAYGSNVYDLYRRTGAYIDKILKGAKPADLPVEQAERFELVINLKTAQGIGLTVPQPVLAQATEVIR